MTAFHFQSANLLDPDQDDLIENIDVIVEAGVIKEVGENLSSSSGQKIDTKGKTIMPGLIDAHVHVVAWLINTTANAALPSSFVSLQAAATMKQMLARGFTTVRDVGGADYGLKLAVENGLIDGPRLVQCGNALGQTGGHIDVRGRFDDRPPLRRIGLLGRVCDGVEAVRLAAREEIREGAEFIKLMVNGGVATAHDPLHSLQFSRAEIEVAVEEAKNAGTYVSAHVYTDDSIRRALECGVHSLEHCNLITEETARLASKSGAVACPTLAVFDALLTEAPRLGLPQATIEKAQAVQRAGLESLQIMRDAEVPMAYGTDLPGQLNATYQAKEFVLRAEVLSPREIIHSATVVGARLCGYESRLGRIAPGYIADLLLIDGNPLADIGVLASLPEHLNMVMRDGKVF